MHSGGQNTCLLRDHLDPGSAAVRPHAVQSAGPQAFTYDLNGNQVTRTTSTVTDRTIAYDGDNRPASVTTPSGTVTYLYAPDGSRLKKTTSTGTILTIGDDIERDTSRAFAFYINPDVKLAGGANTYLHRDHLASVRRITDATGTLTRTSVYEPYGQQIETVLAPLSPTESKSYIGERTDPEDGLTYLHARYYDATLARVLQPDWWDVSDTGVGTNRYSYAGNDPVDASDGNGHCSTGDPMGFMFCMMSFGTGLSSHEVTIANVSKVAPPIIINMATTAVEVGIIDYDVVLDPNAPWEAKALEIAGAAASLIPPAKVEVIAAKEAIKGIEIASDAAKFIGKYTPSAELRFGTTTFGQEAHRAAADILTQELIRSGVPAEAIVDRTLPGARGIDLSVPPDFASRMGFEHLEIKPNTASGMRSFARGMDRWGYDPSTVRIVTYDAFGNLRWGFDF